MIDRLDPLPPLGRFVGDLLALSEAAESGTIERLTIALPIELDVGQSPDGSIKLGASPPTQRIETSILPVFHHLEVTLAADSDTDSDPEPQEPDDAPARG